MIPLAELRIGNIVSFDLHEQEIANLEIMEFASRNGKPIPISEGWLVKFGGRKYEPVNNLWFIGDYTFLFENVEISLYDPDRCVHISNKYRYVHQFQNLYFALTQHELAISENVPA